MLPFGPDVRLIILVMPEPRLFGEKWMCWQCLEGKCQHLIWEFLYDLLCILPPSPMNCADMLKQQWIWLWRLMLCTTPYLPAAPPEVDPPWMGTIIRRLKYINYNRKNVLCWKEMWPHLQGEQWGNRLVVTDGEAHVTLILMLYHFSGSAQPGSQTSLQRCIVGRNGGTGATKAPQDAVSPGWFSLLSADVFKYKGKHYILQRRKWIWDLNQKQSLFRVSKWISNFKRFFSEAKKTRGIYIYGWENQNSILGK